MVPGLDGLGLVNALRASGMKRRPRSRPPWTASRSRPGAGGRRRRLPRHWLPSCAPGEPWRAGHAGPGRDGDQGGDHRDRPDRAQTPRRGRDVELQPRESRLLEFLMRTPGAPSRRPCCWRTSGSSTSTRRPISWRRTSADCVQGGDRGFDSELIETVRSSGYRRSPSFVRGSAFRFSVLDTFFVALVARSARQGRSDCHPGPRTPGAGSRRRRGLSPSRVTSLTKGCNGLKDALNLRLGPRAFAPAIRRDRSGRADARRRFFTALSRETQQRYPHPHCKRVAHRILDSHLLRPYHFVLASDISSFHIFLTDCFTQNLSISRSRQPGSIAAPACLFHVVLAKEIKMFVDKIGREIWRCRFRFMET